MSSFQEWLSRCKRYRSDILGLDNDDIEDHLWVIEDLRQGHDGWDVSVTARKHYHFFSATYVIFHLDTGLYYVTYKQTQGLITRATMKPIGLIDYLLFPWEDNQAPGETFVKHACHYKVTWTVQQIQDEPLRMADVEKRLRARFITQLDHTDAVSRAYCDLLFALCKEYPKMGLKRAELEQMAFWDATNRLTERATLRWLRDNGFDLHKHWVQPTARDMQHFLQRYPDAVHPSQLPTGCFELPYEDASGPGWPIYGPHGSCHLTYRDMPAWVWRQYERFKEQTRIVCSNKRDDILSMDARFKFLMGAVLANERDVKSDKQQRVSSSTSGSGSTNTRLADVTDIEDLLKTGACPGCLVNKMDGYRNAHYKNMERTGLVSNLRNGKIPIEVVARLFEDDQGETYWGEYKAYYNSSYAAQPCSVYIANARNNAAGTIHCAYAQESNPQEMCAREFANRHPSKYKQGKDTLKYPFQWLLWYFMRR
jgi:hypothetical protein